MRVDFRTFSSVSRYFLFTVTHTSIAYPTGIGTHSECFPFLRLGLCVVKRSPSFVKSLARSRTHNFTCRWAVLLVGCYRLVSLKCAFANLPIYFFPCSLLGKRAAISINSWCCEGGHSGPVMKTFFTSSRQGEGLHKVVFR